MNGTLRTGVSTLLGSPEEAGTGSASWARV
jgi:hypothetical protein